MSKQDGTASPMETLFLGGRATARRLQRSRWSVVDGADRGKSFAMDGPRLVIGRSAVCDAVLSDRSVSGTHAEVEATEGGWVYRDLGSTNGSFLGDVRVREVVLPLGARVRVGQSTLQIDPGAGMVEIPLSASDRFHELLGRSVAMRQVFAQLEKVAQLDITVLVTGETGTGKELVARALHKASRRAAGPLVVQDCSAIPKELVESVLFGHERGAFTGAHERRTGSFEQAQSGTLFLDEVGELETNLQPKLLRVLESRELRRVGGEKTLSIDVRVIAATNRDLRAMAANGAFREDLYYRLGVVTIELPPLRQRREDIALLATSLLEQFCKRNPELGPRAFTPAALERLSEMPWPGNVRELRNVVERAASLAEAPEITADDFLPWNPGRMVAPVFAAPMPMSPPAAPPASPARASVPPPPPAAATEPAGAPGAPLGPGHDALIGLPFKDAKARVLEQFEPAYLAALLKRHEGNITRSAAAAGLTRYHLRELCKRYGLRNTDNEPE